MRTPTKLRLSGLLITGLAVVGFLLVQLAVAVVSYILSPDWAGGNSYILLAISSLLTVGLVLLVLLLCRADLRTTLLTDNVGAGDMLRLTALGAAGNLVIATLFALLPFPETWLESYTEHMSPLTSAHPIVAVLSACLCAPLCEELIFRGLSCRALLRGFSAPFAIGLQAVLFAAVHGEPLQMLYALPGGILLGYVYYRTRSLPGALLTHIAFNAAGLILGHLPSNVIPLVFALAPVAALTSYVLLRGLGDSKQIGGDDG